MVNGRELLQMVFEMEAYNVKRKIVNVHAVDQWGQTPLHCALFYGHKEMAELLLNNGTNPSIVDKKGSTALHMVCARPRDLEFVESFFRTCEDNHQSVFR
ncbi:acyl-CoA-binding domain-containing protein 1-like [Trichogramma pretiosum]|uniref:acyl-CoA-binding domain-containing protein 1-like n=1 Tax=Trichogramma pretiosum TaxID=7493 RepID=UPI000C719952|nr:acyl-CoA-binding domain-containing protein 1-like [Trichogramma pretiosum]